MIINQDVVKAFILIFYKEGREELVRELLENAELFVHGVYSVEKKGVDLRLAVDQEDE